MDSHCARCGLYKPLSWQSRVLAYVCTECYRKIIGLDGHLGGVR
jgi:hypothetical protein